MKQTIIDIPSLEVGQAVRLKGGQQARIMAVQRVPTSEGNKLHRVCIRRIAPDGSGFMTHWFFGHSFIKRFESILEEQTS